MPQIGPDEVHKLVEQLQSVRDRAADGKDAVVALYSGLNPERDARITAFSKFINVLNSLQLALTFISKHLLHNDWWNWISGENISNVDKQIYTTEFANFAKVGYVQGIFLAVESSLRLFLRALDPAACNGGMAEFKSIYECLFNSKLAVNPAGGIALLDLMRLVRNTIHNNGVYFSPRGVDAQLTWNGRTYEFKQGKPVDFLTWETLFQLSDALHSLLRQIVEDVNLQRVTTEITDPFSH